MKTITTGTEITFVKTGDKFTLTQSETGFDITPVKLSKNLNPELYTFQELLHLYESGKITIEGFESTDQALVISIITNYIYTTEISKKNIEFESIKTSHSNEITNLETEIRSLKEENGELKSLNLELTKENTRLTQAVEAMQD